MVNYIKTIFLLGILSVILITVGGLLGGQQGMYTALIFSLLMNGVMYFYSDKVALMASGAKPISQKEAPELYAAVSDLAKKMSINMPKLYILPASQANAFATGRDPNHASVAVTQGLMEALSKEEVKAVLAHELSHVKNRDILIASIAAVLASAISFLANMSFYGGFGSRDNKDNRASGAIGIVIALLVPIAASLIQLAISREREFGADESGAKTMGTGKSLARALLAIHDSTRRRPLRGNPAFSSLYIDNPLGGAGGAIFNLFSTHPPVEERVRRLEKI